jgi:group II intron reverse transcriptase/maturase
MPQMSPKRELTGKGQGKAQNLPGSAETPTAGNGAEHLGTESLMEAVVERGNLLAALKRVKQNKGSPGVDGMTVGELDAYLRENWVATRERLLTGHYAPMTVRRVEIPKSGGGMRELGIPTVLDRFIQQALLQVLQPILDPTFSRNSYGFRPGRSAHQAVMAARNRVQSGKRFVVDVDLEKFFDRVQHDVLMGRLEKRVRDLRALGLIRRYLEAGILQNGVVIERHEGTPQGGPLSPLLANVLLDEVDKELEKRGHAFVRYADDCNVYVASRRTGLRVMALLRKLYGNLKLKVNESKSAVDLAVRRKILGYSMWIGPQRAVKLRVAGKTIGMMKEKVRRITGRSGGRSVQRVVEELKAYLPGWKNYFSLAETPGIFSALDEWIRHRLRQVHLKQWKTGKTIRKELSARGVPDWIVRPIAANSRRWWFNSSKYLNHALPNSYFDGLGLPKLGK